MAKTYILEPTELQFTFSEESLQGFLAADITNNLENSFLEVEGYSFKVKYAGQFPSDGSSVFTEDGTIPESAPSVNATILGTSIIIVSPNLPTENCTLTVSIYTGEDDPKPSGSSISKNFSFVDHPRNDLNGIAEIVAPFESDGEEDTIEDQPIVIEDPPTV